MKTIFLATLEFLNKIVNTEHFTKGFFTVLGFLGTIIWNIAFSKYHALTLTTSELLAKAKSNELGQEGWKRLEKEVDAILLNTQQELRHDVNVQQPAWPMKDEIIAVRDVSISPEHSRCLYSTAPGTGFILPIRLKGSSIETLALKFAEELKELLGNNELSLSLVQNRKFAPHCGLKFWIETPEITIQDGEQLLSLRRELSEVARRFNSSAQIVIDLYLADDIAKTFDKRHAGSHFLLEAPNQEETGNLNFNNGPIHYACARKKAFEAIKEKGALLGRLAGNDERYPIPPELLEERLQEVPVVLTEKWTAICLHGDPGSGKTQLANFIIEKLSRDHKMIVFVFSVPALIEKMTSLTNKLSRQDLLLALIDLFCNERESYIPELVPPDLLELRQLESITALRDVLTEAVLSGSHGIVLVADDLDSYDEMRSTLVKLHRTSLNWGLRFILVSRADLELYSGQKRELYYKCLQWKHPQALKIAQSWLLLEQREEMANRFEQGWLRSQESLSLYLLQAIFENQDPSITTPHALLRNAIHAHLSPLEAELYSMKVPVSASLQQLMEMLREGKSSEEILSSFEINSKLSPEQLQETAITLFGILSWRSRFKAKTKQKNEPKQGILYADDIIKWTDGRIADESAAERLLQTGVRFGIFTGYGNGEGRTWKDMLVSDGCAALYLGREIPKHGQASKTHSKTIVEMVAALYQANSLQILTLVLDQDQLTLIAEAIVTTRPALSNVVSDLITEEFIRRFHDAKGSIDLLWTDLWTPCRRVNPSYIAPLAAIFAKMLPYSHELDSKCRERPLPPENMNLVLAIKATQHFAVQDKSAYFADAKSVGVSQQQAAEIAARIWDSNAAQALVQAMHTLAASNVQAQPTKLIWHAWCNRQEPGFLLPMVNHLIHEAKSPATSEKSSALLIDVALESALSRSREDAATHIVFFEEQLSLLKTERKTLIANVLVKWVAFFYGGRMIATDTNWGIDQAAGCARPYIPCNPATTREIFSLLQAGSRFRLPSREDLRGCRLNENVPELIRGHNMPPDYHYDYNRGELLGGRLAIWDGQSEKFITEEPPPTLLLSWRPELLLQKS